MGRYTGASMGPRLGRRGNPLVSPPEHLRSNRLQWGHALGGVETVRGGAGERLPQFASMGPRLGRRGNAEADERAEGGRACFNGATPWEAWKRADGRHDRRARLGFNGATPWEAWKLTTTFHPLPAIGVASMGPRLGRRGNIEFGCQPGWQLVASMGPRLGRRGNGGGPAARTGCPATSFNGATPWEAWKHHRDAPGQHRGRPLQWGHALGGVETIL